MKEITAILALLMLLTGCGQSTDTRESPPTKAETSAVSTEEKMINSTSVTTITATVTTTATVQPTTAVTQETTIQTTEPVSTAEAAVSDAETTSTDNTTKATEPPQTATSAATVTISVTTAQQTAPPIAVTEPITEPKLLLPNDGTDYGKAKAVYEYVRQNGSGTCVNHACMTYKLCCDNGLQCCLVWTDAGMYGHVANIVSVDGIWYVLDTEGGYFLDYNNCFTEVVDIDGNHIADSSIISDMSYDELH